MMMIGCTKPRNCAARHEIHDRELRKNVVELLPGA
jgi:hypothetical protein